MSNQWEDVRRLAYHIAKRYYPLCEANRAVDSDDLHQCAYIAFVEAQQTYKPEQGAFNTWFGFYCRRAYRDALGLCGRKREEHYKALSMDAPLTEDGFTIADTLPDETDPTEGIELSDTCRIVREAVDRLPPQEGAILRQNALQGVPLAEISRSTGQAPHTVRALHGKAMRTLRRDREIRHLRPDMAYRHKGVEAFNRTRTSVVEDAVFRLEDEINVLRKG